MKSFINILCGFMFTLGLSPAAFAETSTTEVPPTDGSCVPMYTIDLAGPRSVRTGEEPRYQILVRNLTDCQIVNLTVVYFFPNIAPDDPSDFSPNPTFGTLGLDPKTNIWSSLSAPPNEALVITHTPTISFLSSANMVSRACAYSLNGPPVCADLKFAVNPPVP